MARHYRNNDLPSLAEAFGQIKSDYRAGKSSRFMSRLRGVSSSGSGADYHIRNPMQWLYQLELIRDFDRNNYIVGQAITRLVANVIQEGIVLDPNTGDDEIDTDLKARWKEWGEDPDQCDYEQEHDWHTMEVLGLAAIIRDGDFIDLPRSNGSLQTVEAHRLRTPTGTSLNVVNGILLDPTTARRKQYWITKEDIDPLHQLRLVSDIEKIDARDANGFRQVFHIYKPRRVSQRRGISMLVPVSDVIGMENDLQFSMLVKAQASTCVTFLRELPESFAAGAPAQTGERTTKTLQDGSIRVIEGLVPGLEITGRPGEKITGFTPNLPNPEFFQHASLLLTFLAINLQMPLAVLLLDPSNTNFSGWRGAIDQARIAWRDMQRWYANRRHKRVYQWQVRRWIAEDSALRNRVGDSKIDLFKHSWNPPSWPYIEPLKDALGDNEAVAGLQISRRRQQANRGRDWQTIAKELVDDNRFIIVQAIEAANLINQKFSNLQSPPDWRELLNPVPAAPAQGLIAAEMASPSSSQGASQ